MKYVVMLVLVMLSGCSSFFFYTLASPGNTPEVPSDSLRWKYTDGKVTQIPVRSSQGELMRLQIDERSTIEVRTTENEDHLFLIQSLKVEDHGEGLLGSNTIWRGYDTRQGAERSVVLREIAEMKIWSREPAQSRIEIKQ